MTTSVASDEAAMRRALELAVRGLGYVEPNPMVGAVVVDSSGRILGEGWHPKYGDSHAEIVALTQAGDAARGATLFVTLEPCCHFGKTPPCSRAVIKAGIARVVVATSDPAPHVNGGGIRELQAAGIVVETGLLELEARQLIAPFQCLITNGRPWFHAKWAMTLDGKIASRTGHSQWISNEKSRAIVHALRGRMDGILVGVNTVIVDNPQLTSRPPGPRVATRIVLDSSARLSLDSNLVKSADQTPLLVFVSPLADRTKCDLLRDAGVEVAIAQTQSEDGLEPAAIAKELGIRRMTNVLLEGGSRVLGAFFDASLIDEVHAFIAPKLVGGINALSPISGLGHSTIPGQNSLDDLHVEKLDADLYLHGHVRRG